MLLQVTLYCWSFSLLCIQILVWLFYLFLSSPYFSFPVGLYFSYVYVMRVNLGHILKIGSAVSSIFVC
jgi:hypothetical protein